MSVPKELKIFVKILRHICEVVSGKLLDGFDVILNDFDEI